MCKLGCTLSWQRLSMRICTFERRPLRCLRRSPARARVRREPGNPRRLQRHVRVGTENHTANRRQDHYFIFAAVGDVANEFINKCRDVDHCSPQNLDWANDRQARAPIAQPRQHRQADPGCPINARPFDASLLVQASWRRSTRISAADVRRGLKASAANKTRSASKRRTIWRRASTDL